MFDIKLLIENEGITETIVRTFVFYLISHGRPILEILNPTLLNIERAFENDFIGMTSGDITFEELIAVRSTLITKIKYMLTEEQKYFLLSFKNKKPDWNLSGINNLNQYPSVKWKLLNLKKMNEKKQFFV